MKKLLILAFLFCGLVGRGQDKNFVTNKGVIVPMRAYDSAAVAAYTTLQRALTNGQILTSNTNITGAQLKADTVRGGNFLVADKNIVVGQTTLNPVNQRSVQYASDGSLPYTGSFISDGVNGSGVAIGAFGNNVGGYIRAIVGNGSPASPTGAPAGKAWGLGIQWYFNDTAALTGSYGGFHWTNLTAPMKATGALTQAKFFTQNGLNRKYNLYMDPTGHSRFYDSSFNTWDSVSTGPLAVTGSAFLNGSLMTMQSNDLALGSDNAAITLTANTTKAAKLTFPTYGSTTQRYAGLLGVSNSTDNITYIGGGSGAYYASTVLNFYTAANNATTTGTIRASINSTGVFNTFKGADVVSAATITPTGNLFHVTGTTTITSVSATGISAGTTIVIIFDGALTFTDGSNLKIAGNFTTTADDTITLWYDGTNWYETARAIN